MFERIVRQCMDGGLVKGEGFAVDASVIEADASRFQRIEGSEIEWSEEQLARRAIKEYVDALESENAPTNPDRKPKAMSPTDPTAAWTRRGRNKVMFGYSLNYLIDMENAVILDVEATPTRISKEVDATETMIERTEERFDLKPRHIAGDVAYGAGEMLGWLVEHGIDPHIPVWDKGKGRIETFSRDDFAYDKERDLYICPEGKSMKTTGRMHDGKTLYYPPKSGPGLLREFGAFCPLERMTKCAVGTITPRTDYQHVARSRGGLGAGPVRWSSLSHARRIGAETIVGARNMAAFVLTRPSV